ncbi:nitrate reductase [Shimia biformata]|uniref:nitrate reductase n=1 Tax=Shimia biformata TaxID=1294299 RepID=UPI00194DF5AA|nr:nitrate reductase [Shimia biformata]
MDGAGLPEAATGAEAPVTTATTCAYCGVGCGVLATPAADGSVAIKGDPDHPANLGRLCVKGSALGETLSTEGRLLAPRINGQDADWDTALDLVADKFHKAIDTHGPDSVAFYVSGQLLTEDYYVANKLMKGFIGSANIDTNSRLCMASSVAGHKRAFGTDTVPGTYEDIEQADLVVLVGSNLAWCHPVLYQRLAAAKAANPRLKVVNIDPRRTATSDLADLHLAIAPGSDVALFNALLVHIHEMGAVDSRFVADHVDGFDGALAAASSDDPARTGLTEAEISRFLSLWTAREKVVTIYSQGVNQSSSGADKVNAILNCHLATGRIGKPGMGPFSVTGQPNAMGGREVGGLANMLANHLDLENADHRDAVQGFWASPTMADKPGLKAVDMFKAVKSGQIKALWVMCTNPVVSMPDADYVRKAIAGCEFVAVSDMYGSTDTAQLAHVALPATGWGEKDGTVTNSERVISRQRPFRQPPGQARHDWAIIADVGRRMGWEEAFAFSSPAEVFDEYARLSTVTRSFGRDFDISGLSGLSVTDYDNLSPTRWPVTSGKTGGRFFGDGGFFTASGRANMLALRSKAVAQAPDSDLPFVLNTGRVRDQWHTMTRTGQAARLSQHTGEPYLEIHPEDAAKLGLEPATLARLANPHGSAVLRVKHSDNMRRGEVFAPMHWTGQTAVTGRINALVAPVTDPVSGQPESKAATVAVAPYAPAYYGFAVSLSEFHPQTGYWARARVANGWQAEFADITAPEDWLAFAQTLFGIEGADVTSLIDDATGIARVALYKDGKLVAALFASRDPVAVARGFVAGQLGTCGRAVLAGQPGADQPDPGPTVCACFNVGINTILRGIDEMGLTSVDAIGEALDAGTNCGSCRPELSALLNTRKQAAE